MQNLDSVHIDIEDNEDVAELFEGCKAGHVVRITMEATIAERTEDRVAASIDGIEQVDKIGGYDEDEEDEDMEDVEEDEEGADEEY